MPGSEIDVTRGEFDRLEAKVTKLEESTHDMMMLLAGGFNDETKLIERGLVATLKDLADELGEVKNDIKSFVAVVRQALIQAGRAVLVLIVTGVVTFFVQHIWPVLTHSFFQTTTSTVTHTVIK